MIESNDAFRDRLAAPFHRRDIEWRIGRCGKKRDGSGIWATCFAYVTNRAVMHRLDEACGVGGWKTRFEPIGNGALLCGIAIRIGEEWVEKCDGSDATDIEPVKGTISSAMKRAAVQWGIGRYLYDLPEGWAEITDDRNDYAGRLPKEDGGEWFRWRPPALPEWALPKGETREPEQADAPVDDGGEQYAPTQGEETQDPTREAPPARPAAQQPPANEKALRDEIAALKKRLPEATFRTICGRIGGEAHLAKASIPQLKAVLNALRDNALAQGGGR